MKRSHSAVRMYEVFDALINNCCLREGVTPLHNAMTDGVDLAEVFNDSEITFGEGVNNESNCFFVVVCFNVFLDLFAFRFDFEAGVPAHADTFDKAFGHDFTVVHVDKLELQGRAPTVHN